MEEETTCRNVKRTKLVISSPFYPPPLAPFHIFRSIFFHFFLSLFVPLSQMTVLPPPVLSLFFLSNSKFFKLNQIDFTLFESVIYNMIVFFNLSHNNVSKFHVKYSFPWKYLFQNYIKNICFFFLNNFIVFMILKVILNFYN